MNKFLKDFEETTNQEITFEQINLKWDGSFELTGLLIADHHNDTLTFIQKIETSFKDLKKLQKNDFNLKYIEASGVLSLIHI